MPRILRKIRKGRWHRDCAWMGEDDVQADALDDLRTRGNELSVWEVDDDDDSLRRVVSAMAATADTLSNFDYALMDCVALRRLQIKSERKEGQSPDDGVNGKHLHLVNLTAESLMDLLKVMASHAKKKRIKEKEVLNLLVCAVQSKRFQLQDLKEGLRRKVEKRLKCLEN